MSQIIIENSDFEFVVVGPVDKKRDGVIIKTQVANEDLVGFANLVYSSPNDDFTFNALKLSEFSFDGKIENGTLNLYSYVWQESNLFSDFDFMNKKLVESRKSKILYAWKINPKQNFSLYHAKVSPLIKQYLLRNHNQLVKSLRDLSLNISIESDLEERKKLTIENIKWHLSPVMYLGEQVND